MNTLNKYSLIGSLLATTVLSGFLATTVLFSSAAHAAVGVSSDVADGDAETNINEDDEITIGFNQPQSLSVSQPNNEVNRASGGTINKTWHVVSNNAVGVQFTGRSPKADGSIEESPTFYKVEVDADGNKIIAGQNGHTETKYDHLVTTYGVEIAGQGSVVGTSGAWGTGSTPSGQPQNLVKERDATDGPDAHFGSIMPDDDGRFTMTLSAKGVGDVATTQSGDYQVTIVASFYAEEKANGTVTADSINFLTAEQEYNSVASVATTSGDNSVWNSEAQDLSDTADNTDAANE
jgi:hypothetical protein